MNNQDTPYSDMAMAWSRRSNEVDHNLRSKQAEAVRIFCSEKINAAQNLRTKGRKLGPDGFHYIPSDEKEDAEAIYILELTSEKMSATLSEWALDKPLYVLETELDARWGEIHRVISDERSTKEISEATVALELNGKKLMVDGSVCDPDGRPTKLDAADDAVVNWTGIEWVYR